MAKIAVDIDSTLYDFETPAREAFFAMAHEKGDKSLFAGAYHPWTEWRSPADACGPEAWMEAIGRCHAPEVIKRQTPYSGAVETCQALMSEGHRLLYISNRNEACTQATGDWLQYWGFLDGEDGAYEVKCLMGDKKPHLSGCQYLIDDRPKTLIEFVYDFNWKLSYGSQNVEKKRRGFGLMYEYNRALTDIPGVYLAPTWAGLNYYLVGKGVLSEPAHMALEEYAR